MIYIKVSENGMLHTFDCTISDSVRYETVKFDFPKSWDGYTKTAVFRNGDIILSVILNSDSDLCVGADECYIPHEVIKAPEFTVSVFGVSGDSRVTASQAAIRVIQSGYGEGGEPSDPTPSEYEQLITLANETKEIAQSVRTDADNGVFKGDKGDDGYTPQKGVDYFTEEDIAGLNIPLVDQNYNPDSENAQSGKAVAEALATIPETIVDQTYNAESKNAQSGKAVAEVANGRIPKVEESDIMSYPKAVVSISDLEMIDGKTYPKDTAYKHLNIDDGYSKDYPTIPDVSITKGFIATRDTSTGNLWTGIPVDDVDCANKKYVDDTLAQSGKAVAEAVENKQDKLTAGDNITIDENNVISVTYGGLSAYTLITTDIFTEDRTGAFGYPLGGDYREVFATIKVPKGNESNVLVYCGFVLTGGMGSGAGNLFQNISIPSSVSANDVNLLFHIEVINDNLVFGMGSLDGGTSKPHIAILQNGSNTIKHIGFTSLSKTLISGTVVSIYGRN